MIPSLTIKFFQPSYLRRYSNLSSPYEVNLILRSFSVFISFQESLAIWLVDRSRLKLKANEKGKNCCESVFLSFFFFSNKHSNIRRSRLENKLGGRESNFSFDSTRSRNLSSFVARLFEENTSPLAFHERLKEGRYIFFAAP